MRDLWQLKIYLVEIFLSGQETRILAGCPIKQTIKRKI